MSPVKKNKIDKQIWNGRTEIFNYFSINEKILLRHEKHIFVAYFLANWLKSYDIGVHA